MLARPFLEYVPPVADGRVPCFEDTAEDDAYLRCHGLSMYTVFEISTTLSIISASARD